MWILGIVGELLYVAIARKLGLTEATVRTYISRIFAATGFTNRGELTIAAIKAGY